jgi:hypothetical protein
MIKLQETLQNIVTKLQIVIINISYACFLNIKQIYNKKELQIFVDHAYVF